jgi:hypothetical protein
VSALRAVRAKDFNIRVCRVNRREKLNQKLRTISEAALPVSTPTEIMWYFKHRRAVIAAGGRFVKRSGKGRNSEYSLSQEGFGERAARWNAELAQYHKQSVVSFDQVRFKRKDHLVTFEELLCKEQILAKNRSDTLAIQEALVALSQGTLLPPSGQAAGPSGQQAAAGSHSTPGQGAAAAAALAPPVAAAVAPPPPPPPPIVPAFQPAMLIPAAGGLMVMMPPPAPVAVPAAALSASSSPTLVVSFSVGIGRSFPVAVRRIVALLDLMPPYHFRASVSV